MAAGKDPAVTATSRLDSAWRRRHAAFFSRPGIARRIRHAAALSALSAAGDWRGLEQQVRWALDDRVPLPWLSEICLQSYLFTGYPRAISTLQILGRCANESGSGTGTAWRDDQPRGTWRKRGRELCALIYGPKYRPLLAMMRRTHPDLAEWMIEEGYGKVLARPFLGPRVRELCVVSLLAAQGSWVQLQAHLAGARRVGARRIEVREAMETGLRMAPRPDRRQALLAWIRAIG